MKLFWAQGYDGTSLAELTDAMGINRPSLYAAFGSKEELFRRAVTRYVEGPGSAVSAALALPTARAVVERLLEIYVSAAEDEDRPRGCFLVNGALSCSADGAGVHGTLAAEREAGFIALRKRLERARREGDLGDDGSPTELAHYVWTVLHGITIQAQSGATARELRKVARRAMLAWPAAAR